MLTTSARVVFEKTKIRPFISRGLGTHMAVFDRSGRMRIRVRQNPLVTPSHINTSTIDARPFKGRVRMRYAPQPIQAKPFKGRIRTRYIPQPMIGPMPKRRGRAPAHIPDPWSDLEWESHPEAQVVVSEYPAGMTLEQIGAAMGITRERVRQIERAALDKLKENSGSDIAWIGKLTMGIPECRRCGEAFVRATGRQTMCSTCEATRKRRRPATIYPAPYYQPSVHRYATSHV